jgi:hypothetical protein
MNKIYCMVHADGFSFKAFGINFGARTNQNSALDGLKSHLLPGSTLTKTETAGRRYSFVIQKSRIPSWGSSFPPFVTETRKCWPERNAFGSDGYRRRRSAMNKGEKWRCANPACQAEIIVTRASALPGSEKVRCACGSIMKRQYEKPMLRKAMAAGGKSN